MRFSKIFEHIGNSDTGRSLFTTSLQFFLWTVTMFPIFQSPGKIQIFSQFWNIMERYLIIDGLRNFTIIIEIPSYPWAKSILKSLLKKISFLQRGVSFTHSEIYLLCRIPSSGIYLSMIPLVWCQNFVKMHIFR